mmetsp:Transcript_33161/g.43675  ORF Transcript_33161/g.43675 Transcript_33161/m.43675 type:complete len:210 (+) Transcript_33161:291-920(+)
MNVSQLRYFSDSELYDCLVLWKIHAEGKCVDLIGLDLLFLAIAAADCGPQNYPYYYSESRLLISLSECQMLQSCCLTVLMIVPMNGAAHLCCCSRWYHSPLPHFPHSANTFGIFLGIFLAPNQRSFLFHSFHQTPRGVARGIAAGWNGTSASDADCGSGWAGGAERGRGIWNMTVRETGGECAGVTATFAVEAAAAFPNHPIGTVHQQL